MGRLTTGIADGTPKLPSPRRVRRSASEARSEILDAAERRLLELGPEGLRLQQIAADVGISHPAILHHFGMRERLLEAVIARAFERLESDLMRLSSSLARPRARFDLGRASTAPSALDSGESILAAIEHAFATLVKSGHGRVLAWLLLSGHVPDQSLVSLRRLAEFAHQQRQRATPEVNISFEDTRFRILLVAISVLGESVAGPAVRQSLGVRSASESQRFHAWLMRLLAPPETLSEMAHPEAPR